LRRRDFPSLCNGGRVVEAIHSCAVASRYEVAIDVDRDLYRRVAHLFHSQFGLFVLASLGAIVLLLTVLGTYLRAETMAVMRTREVGIRAALGATSKSLTILVLRESVVLVGIALGVGLLLSYIGANVIRAFLFRVQPLDPATLGAVAALILLLAVATSLRPASRAARVDLAQVLRSE
jgi:putative ABC transport system permease protein